MSSASVARERSRFGNAEAGALPVAGKKLSLFFQLRGFFANQLLVSKHGVEPCQHHTGYFFTPLLLQPLPLLAKLVFCPVELGKSILLVLESALQVFRIEALDRILHIAFSSAQSLKSFLLTLLGSALLLAALLLLALLLKNI